MQDICYLISIAHLPVPVFLWKITEISENKTTVSPTYVHYFDPAERLQITSLFQTEHLILTNVGQAGRLNFFSLRSHPPSAYQVRKESTLCELYCVQYSNLYTCFSRFWNIYQRVTSWKGHVYNHSYTVWNISLIFNSLFAHNLKLLSQENKCWLKIWLKCVTDRKHVFCKRFFAKYITE